MPSQRDPCCATCGQRRFQTTRCTAKSGWDGLEIAHVAAKDVVEPSGHIPRRQLENRFRRFQEGMDPIALRVKSVQHKQVKRKAEEKASS